MKRFKNYDPETRYAVRKLIRKLKLEGGRTANQMAAIVRDAGFKNPQGGTFSRMDFYSQWGNMAKKGFEVGVRGPRGPYKPRKSKAVEQVETSSTPGHMERLVTEIMTNPSINDSKKAAIFASLLTGAQ